MRDNVGWIIACAFLLLLLWLAVSLGDVISKPVPNLPPQPRRVSTAPANGAPSPSPPTKSPSPAAARGSAGGEIIFIGGKRYAKLTWTMGERLAYGLYRVDGADLVGHWGWCDEAEFRELDLCGVIHAETIRVTPAAK